MQNDVRLIDANALKEDLKNMLARVTHESDLDFDHSHAKIWTATITGIQHSIKRLDNAPTISAVPVVHGRWIRANDEQCYFDVEYVCGECQFVVAVSGIGTPILYGYKYCPNCGAKMDGGAADANSR